ncbi:MAG: transposase [Eubacterium sp.]|nr:transposase [Eubacterium sp.]
MAFVENTYQQLSLVDSMNRLSERERKLLERSWAKPFGDQIFPRIDEKRFADFYSTKSPRPNTPVNIVLGGMLLEELLDLTDEEIIETLNFDVRFQYALHTTAYDIQPFSTNTFRRFRIRNDANTRKTGTDILGEYMQEMIRMVEDCGDPRLNPLLRRKREKAKQI